MSYPPELASTKSRPSAMCTRRRLSSRNSQKSVATFSTPDGKTRSLAPSRLPPHETAFAMTIHKSQGSEFDEVVVLLPAGISPILSRELIYTAVTRARSKVTIFGDAEVVAHAVARRIERASGLREAIWGDAS